MWRRLGQQVVGLLTDPTPAPPPRPPAGAQRRSPGSATSSLQPGGKLLRFASVVRRSTLPPRSYYPPRVLR